MKVTLLGRCGAYPTAGEATTGFLLQTDSMSLLVDAGSGIAERLQRFLPLEALDAVIISHYHHDHVADLGVLQYGVMITKRAGKRDKPLHTYLPCADQASYDRYRFEPWCKQHAITADSVVEIGNLRVTFLSTLHPVPCLAMRFEQDGKVVSFSGDSAYIPEMAPFVAGSDLFICETNFYAHEDGSITQHFTSREVGQISAQAGVKQLVMTHLPADGDHQLLLAEVKQEYDGHVDLAATGWTVHI